MLVPTGGAASFRRGRRPRRPGRKSQKHTEIPGEFVEWYGFAGDLFIFSACTARAAEGVGPYDVDVNFLVLSYVPFIPNSAFRIVL